MQRILLPTFVMTIFMACVPSKDDERPCYFSDTNVQVDTCNDGDSCIITTPIGFKVRIRLAGIDAPEMSGGGQPFAKEARAFLQTKAVGRKVQLRLLGEDVYRRALVEIFEEGQTVSINRQMVRNGYALVYRGRGVPRALDRAAYEEDEAAARAARLNIWSLSSFESPADYRLRSKHR